MTKTDDVIIPYLRNQFENARPLLFVGAGFSSGAKNLDGEPLPIGEHLAKVIWGICFPSTPFDPNASLQDIYAAALSKNPNELKEVLIRKLTVVPESISEQLSRYFFLPWHRIYTLNIDNLADAVSRRVSLPRRLLEISGANPTRSLFPPQTPDLPVLYLNGNLSDVPHNVTFTTMQYAHKLAFPDHLYQELVSDIVSRPVIFVGTRLDEPPLWQNIEIRKARGARGMSELRPRSYLVTPTLDQARQARLSEFNIVWIQMTAEEFSEAVLKHLDKAAEVGLRLLKATTPESDGNLHQVGDLATEPKKQSEFLLGQEPIWADIQSGRAIERKCDTGFWGMLQSKLLVKEPRGIIAITGTAGSGKSTCIMRLALRATAEGSHVAWIDRDNNLSPREIITGMRGDSLPGIIAIDDADLFGSSLPSMLLDIATLDHHPLVLIAIRSGVIDRVLDRTVLKDVPISEVIVPHLEDDDINSLIDVLDRENRLGALKGKHRQQQFAMFKVESGRQLLVAMYNATSGQKLMLKVPDEFSDLPPKAQRVYALIALATTFRYKLSRTDILLALNDSTNESLNEIEQLVRRHIVVEVAPAPGFIQARHRVIAELIRDNLQGQGRLTETIFSLAFLAATHRRSEYSRRRRNASLLRSMINHDFLYKALGKETAQVLYQQLEDLLSDDHHYWLQRGSLEVEVGDLRLAENFLSQARGLAAGDLLVENEWAYLLFRKAINNPRAVGAADYVREATAIAESIIKDPRTSPHPFHVIGSQGLAWSRSGIIGQDEKARYLRGLKVLVESGLSRFPRNLDLRQLRDDLQREYLSLALST